MINYDSKWVKQILDLQHEDGSWGCFHTLSNPTKEHPITTEQALRRLRVLGLTKDDEPIKRAIAYMEWCLAQPVSPVFHEKLHNAEIFSDLILAANIMRFDRANKVALPIAHMWKRIIESAFAEGFYNHRKYVEAYESTFYSKLNPKAGRLVDFVCFYQLVLLCGGLTERAELLLFDFCLSHPTGIFYVYDKPLNVLPETFTSRQTSRWLAAVELLAYYRRAALQQPRLLHQNERRHESLYLRCGAGRRTERIESQRVCSVCVVRYNYRQYRAPRGQTYIYEMRWAIHILASTVAPNQ
jgi:hypothetical protein